MNKKIIIFFGPPGSGKGTLAQSLISLYNWKHISTGNLLREHVARKTLIGQQVSKIISQGNLVSDGLIVDMVQSEISQLREKKPIIFDGFPRTYHQACAFHEKLDDMKISLEDVLIVLFELDDGKVLERVSSRLVCSNSECSRVYSLKDDIAVCSECNSSLEKRRDDDISVIKKRLEEYHSTAKELLMFWKQSGYEVCSVDTGTSYEASQRQFLRCIDMSDDLL